MKLESIQSFRKYIDAGNNRIYINNVELKFKEYGVFVDLDYIEFYADVVSGYLEFSDNDFWEGDHFYGGIFRENDEWRCVTDFGGKEESHSVTLSL